MRSKFTNSSFKVISLILVLLTSNSILAQQAIDPPPGAPIDDYIIPMLLLAFIIAVFYYKRRISAYNPFKNKNMENSTIPLKKLPVAISAVVIMFFTAQVFAQQVQQNGVVFVKDGGVLTVKNGPFNFGTGTGDATSTGRDAANFGRILFLQAANSVGAANAHSINGYASATGKTAFIFPVGVPTIYAPSRVFEATATSTYNSAYFRSSPLLVESDINGANLNAISDDEYWVISGGTSARVTLSYRADANALTTSLATDLTIAGLNSATDRWEAIPSTIDGSNAFGAASQGSISSDAVVNFATYSRFTLGVKGACSELVAAVPADATTWNGSSWSNGIPRLTSAVTITGNYPSAQPSFVCNRLVINNGVTVTLDAGESIEIVNGASGAGRIVMASTANVIQRSDAATAPIVRLRKVATAMKVNDYIYMGSPITNTDFSTFPTLGLSSNDTNIFDLSYVYRNGTTGGSPWEFSNNTNGVGRGIIRRIAPRPFLSSPTDSENVQITFNGRSNNGVKTIVGATVGAPTDARNNILLSNPYPSAIDGAAFLKENVASGATDGYIAVWQTLTDSNNGRVYANADYSIFNLSGVVVTGPTGTFTGVIATGQGFKTAVRSATPIEFNNCMRITRDNVDLKSATQPVDRYKVNLTTADGIFSQILVAYSENGTLGYDVLYDARRFSTSPTQLFSILDNSDTKLSINARPNFVNTDAVNVGISKSNTNTETLNFQLAEQEGVFANGTATVYIHDKVLDTYHNLTAGSFSFTTSDISIENRFELVYQTGTLSSGDTTLPQSNVSLIDTTFSFDASAVVNNIQIHDMAGRLVEDYKKINASTFTTSFNHAEGVYIANLYYDNGFVDSVKLIHAKR